MDLALLNNIHTKLFSLSISLHNGYKAEEIKNIGNIAKFIVPAKFSNCFMYTDNNRPNDPSISPNNTIKGKANSQLVKKGV